MKYDYIYDIESDGTRIVEKDGKYDKYGLVESKTENIILECEYDSIWNVEEECIIVEKNRTYGLIEIKTGRIILDCKYHRIDYLEVDGTRKVWIDENNYFEFNYQKWKILDKFIGEV